LLVEIWKRSKQIAFRDIEVSLWENFTRLPSIITGVLGSWGIGSLEVRMPGSTHVIAFMIFVSIIFLAVRYANYLELQSIFTQIVFILAIPLFTLTRSNLRVGEWVQPRYILPIFYGLIMLSILIILNNSNMFNKYSLYIMGALTNIAYSFAIYTTLRRYTVGLSEFNFNLVSNNSWWWDFKYLPSPFIVYLFSSLSFLILSIFIGILINKELSKKTTYFSKKTS
jgi:membrane-associated HD superfamily phosphohydrolase